MSHQLELLTENPLQWIAVSFVTPEIHKKEIKPFVICKFSTLLEQVSGLPFKRNIMKKTM